jgi:hypothetical protein
MRSTWFGWAVILLTTMPSVALPQDPVAQGRMPCDTAVAGGSLRGLIRNDSTDAPIAGVRIGIHQQGDARCATRTDSGGRFEMGLLPAGPYRLLVLGGSDYRGPVSIPVEIRADSTTDVAVRLQPWSLLGECRKRAACASLVDSPPEDHSSLSQAERLTESVLRTSIALAGWTPQAEWVPCAVVASEAVLAALRGRVPALAPASDCGASDPARESGFVHAPTGVPAWHFEVVDVGLAGTEILARSRSSDGLRGLTSWTCRFARAGAGDYWIARHCVVTLRG